MREKIGWASGFQPHFDGRDQLILRPERYDDCVARLASDHELGVAIQGMFVEGVPGDLADRIPWLRSISVLHMRRPEPVRSLYFFRELEGLEAHLRDLDGVPEIVRLPRLRAASLAWSAPLRPKLEEAATQIQELRLITFDTAEQTFASVTPLQHLERLEILYGNPRSLRGIETLAALRRLAITGTRELEEWAPLAGLSDSLEALSLNAVSSPPTLYEAVGRLTRLRSLKLLQMPTPKSLDFVERLQNLVDLRLIGTKLDRKQRGWLRGLKGRPEGWLVL